LMKHPSQPRFVEPGCDLIGQLHGQRARTIAGMIDE
jgi:hypothetical protein